MHHLAGKDVSVSFQFRVGGDLVIPDADTVTYTFYGADGVAVGSLTDVSIAATSTTLTITIPAAQNAITEATESRFIHLTFEKDGETYELSRSYNLTSFLPITASADSVRAITGLSAVDLPDSRVSVITTYFDLLEEYGDDFSTALRAGGLDATNANRMITAWAALEILPSLQISLAQEEASDTASYRRLAKIDFPGLKAYLSNVLDEAYRGISGTVSADPVFATTAVGTDAITGE